MLITKPSSGQSHTASRHYSSVDVVLGKECSYGDHVRSQCRLAFSMAQDGSYAAAQESLQSLHSQIRGTLKLEQRVASFARLIALLQAIRWYVLRDLYSPAKRLSFPC
jgi:xylose isomerase